MDMRKRYEAAKKDPDLLTHEPELRLLDAQLHKTLQAANEMNCEALLKRARETWEKMEAAQASQNAEEYLTRLKEVGEILKGHHTTAIEWKEVREIMEQRGRTLERETRRIKESQTSMSQEQVLAVVEYVVDSIRMSVEKYADRIVANQILGKITADVGQLVGKPVPSAALTTRHIN